MTFPDIRNVGGSLQFRLGCGLRQLANLKALRAVEFASYGKKQCLGWDDIEWMLDNWKSLHRICGCLHTKEEIETQLEHLLEQRGISRRRHEYLRSSSPLEDSTSTGTVSEASSFDSDDDDFI
ncbi:MAG: hypothetical protein J3Q66DRAFT_375766 [Benniella sp.]|nr:MAG: hypothetical protein J3Q66DRAFT_375766 [Benniella sp.]